MVGALDGADRTGQRHQYIAVGVGQHNARRDHRAPPGRPWVEKCAHAVVDSPRRHGCSRFSPPRGIRWKVTVVWWRPINPAVSMGQRNTAYLERRGDVVDHGKDFVVTGRGG
jgi:hypothetical protein